MSKHKRDDVARFELYIQIDNSYIAATQVSRKLGRRIVKETHSSQLIFRPLVSSGFVNCQTLIAVQAHELTPDAPQQHGLSRDGGHA